MQVVKMVTVLVCALFFASPGNAQQQQQGSEVLVGHIDYLDGNLLRYVPEEKDWVSVVKDAPFGITDTLYAGDKTHAEILMPNNTLARIGGSTQIQLLRLEADVSELDVVSGVVRFYNKSSNAVIKVTTPFGYVMAAGQTSFDLYVGDESVEVISLKGRVDYVRATGTSKYEVKAELSSIIGGRTQVTSGQGRGDAGWIEWNDRMDRLWQSRTAAKVDSGKYLPQQLYDEGYALEENGRWDRVYYEGGYHYFWRPIYVSAGWAPFSRGRWTMWYGDNCWIPAEPFGYVTHHYGNWVYVDRCSCWYWVPPVSYLSVGAGPSWFMGCSWYPGRVSWIYSGLYIGWYPLMPYEPYYCHYYWGPYATVIIIDGDDDHHHHDGHHGHHSDHVVVVNQSNFYTVNNYSTALIMNLDKAAIRDRFQKAAVITDKIIKNFKDNRDKFNFGGAKPSVKPHNTVLARVRQNLSKIKRSGRPSAAALRQKVEKIRKGRITGGRDIEPRKVTSKLVPSSEVSNPRSATKFTQQYIKREPVIQRVKPALSEDSKAQPGHFQEKEPKPVRKDDNVVFRPEPPKLPRDAQDSGPALKHDRPERSTIERPVPPRDLDSVKPERPSIERPAPPRDIDSVKPERNVPVPQQKPEGKRPQLQNEDREPVSIPKGSQPERPPIERPGTSHNFDYVKPEQYESPLRSEPLPRQVETPRHEAPVQPRLHEQPAHSHPDTNRPSKP
jgi:hypothetical protein